MSGSFTREAFLKTSKLFALKLLHFAVTIALFAAAWMLFRYRGFHPVDTVGFRYNFFALFVYIWILLFFHRTYNAYLLGYSRIRALVFSQAVSQFFSALIVYLVACISWARMANPLAFIPMLAVQFVWDAVWSYFGNAFFFRLNPPRRTLLIYRSEVDKKRLGNIGGKPCERLYRVADEIQYDGDFDGIQETLKNYEAVFVAGVNSPCRNGILKYCKEHNVPGFFLPHVGDVIMQEARHIQSFDAPVLYIARTVLNPEYVLIKRGFDVFASLLGIVLLSPIMLITAIAIKAYDGGPVIYKQTRLTKDGKRFEIYKFRSMRVDAEKDGVARLSTGDRDDRVTPVGRVVRKCRLDELPQLVNILKGDMSLVGPRPERPEIAEQYYQTMPDFRLRLQVRAGLTGYAQVYGKYNTDPYEKLEFDLLYINHMSVLTDLKLIFATMGVLFTKDSTQGVAAGQVTAMNARESPEQKKSAQAGK